MTPTCAAVTLETIQQQLGPYAGQTVLALGHIDGQSLVLPGPRGTLSGASVTLAQLHEVSRQLDIRLLVFDCGPGLPAPVEGTSRIPVGLTQSRLVLGVAQGAQYGDSITLAEFFSGFVAHLADATADVPAAMVGVLEEVDPRQADRGGHSLHLVVCPAHWQGETLQIGPAASRVFYGEPANGSSSAHGDTWWSALWLGALSAVAMGTLAAFYWVLRRTAPAVGHTPQLPVHLYYEPLHELNLAEEVVSDTALRDLSRLPHIKRLHLSGGAITDAGLRYVARCKDLEVVTLRRTKVSPQGVARLRRQLPSCLVRAEP